MSDMTDMIEVNVLQPDGALVDHFCTDGLDRAVWRINKHLDYTDDDLQVSVDALVRGAAGGKELAQRVRFEVASSWIFTGMRKPAIPAAQRLLEAAHGESRRSRAGHP